MMGPREFLRTLTEQRQMQLELFSSLAILRTAKISFRKKFHKFFLMMPAFAVDEKGWRTGEYLRILVAIHKLPNTTILKNQMMNIVQLETFKIVGLQVRTTNKDAKASKDLMDLWKKFSVGNIASLIANKIDNDIYSLYTDYEKDYSAGYTAVLGYKVESFDEIPTGLVGREFQGGKYLKFKTKGKRPQAVVDKWKEIWEDDKELNRTYTADFEVYGVNSQDPDNAEVDIYVATK